MWHDRCLPWSSHIMKQGKAFGLSNSSFDKRSLFFLLSELLSRQLQERAKIRKHQRCQWRWQRKTRRQPFELPLETFHMRLHWPAFNLFSFVVAGRPRQNMVLQNSGRYKADRGQSGDQENQWATLSFRQRQSPVHDGFKLVKWCQEELINLL